MVINKKKLLPVIIISILLIITIIFSIKITIKDSNNMLASKKTYGNIKIDDFDNNRTNLYDVEQDILNYILEKNDIDKNMVKNVEYLFYNKECKYKPTLKIELDDSFDSNSDLDKLTKVNGIYENAKNTCDFNREMNWHDYFTKMIAF